MPKHKRPEQRQHEQSHDHGRAYQVAHVSATSDTAAGLRSSPGSPRCRREPGQWRSATWNGSWAGPSRRGLTFLPGRDHFSDLDAVDGHALNSAVADRATGEVRLVDAQTGQIDVVHRPAGHVEIVER